MNRIKIILTVILSFFSQAPLAQKMVAVGETQCVDKSVSNFKKIMVRGTIEEAVDNTPGYVKYDRAMFDAIAAEHQFQHSGDVKDEDIKRLGEMAGVQYVIVPEVAIEDNYFTINVRMIDVENGQSKTAQELCEATAPEIKKTCDHLASRLLGNSPKSSGSTVSKEPKGDETSGSKESILTITVNNVSFDMIKVEAGNFIMGCTDEQGQDCYGSEKPYHRVTISKDYYIGKLEVSQELYQTVMGSNPSHWQAFDRPVENVSWYEAQVFCERLSRMTGRNFSLPTEAEWEYAARGGKKASNTKYSGGWRVGDVAWYDCGSTHVCGTKRANDIGAYDMSGNVWEWCLDWFGDYYSTSQTDPNGASSGSHRVLRGGSCFNKARDCRVTSRGINKPSHRDNYCGFRIVLH